MWIEIFLKVQMKLGGMLNFRRAEDKQDLENTSQHTCEFIRAQWSVCSCPLILNLALQSLIYVNCMEAKTERGFFKSTK